MNEKKKRNRIDRTVCGRLELLPVSVSRVAERVDGRRRRRLRGQVTTFETRLEAPVAGEDETATLGGHDPAA